MIDGLLILLVLFLFIPGSIATFVGTVKLSPAFVVAMLLFPLLMFGGRLRWVWPDFLVIAMFASFFISTALTSPIERTIESLGRIVLMSSVPYMAGRYIMQDMRRMRRTIGLLVALVAVCGVFAIPESLARFNIHSVLWDVPYRPHKDLRMGLTRAHSWTSHTIMFGLCCAILMPMILVSAKLKMNAVGRWAWLKFFAVGTGCFLSFSTGAWGPAAISIALVIWDFYAPLKQKSLWLVTYTVTIGGYFLLEFASGRPLMRILMMELHLSSPDAWYYRWRLYERVYAVMPGHWWMGHGQATPEAFTQGFQSSIDNNFLVILLHYGRVGLILWCAVAIAMIVYGGKAVWVRTDATKMVHLTRAMCFGLICILLTQFSVALFSTAGTLYWLLMGMILGATLNCRREQKQIEAMKKAKKKRRGPRPTAADAPPRAALR